MIFFDAAAGVGLSPKAFDAMKPWLTEKYGNPSTLYSIGKEAKKAVEEARKQIAECVKCKPEHVYFTSGGTEADNWALQKTAYLGLISDDRICVITSEFEHHAVLHTARALSKSVCEIGYLPVDQNGIVSLKKLYDDSFEYVKLNCTSLISVMMVNNELGTVQPIREIAEIAHKNGALFHTDAVQAAGHIDINVERDKIDLLSLSAHKFHGPRGVGALICTVSDFPAMMYGGAQEYGKRPGTENVAGIVGMAVALTEQVYDLENKMEYVKALKARLVERLSKIDGLHFNGGSETAPTGILNLRVDKVEGEALLHMLDARGICVSAGSACTSGSLEGSHVLRAIGLEREEAHNSIRISLDHTNTMDEVEKFLFEFAKIISILR